jgi:hypothetical protein
MKIGGAESRHCAGFNIGAVDWSDGGALRAIASLILVFLLLAFLPYLRELP